MMASLAVVILTLNEKENIRECIKTASFADEVLVVDSGSNDGTQDIAC
ncbi:MAG: glycosyltransferase, partial [Schwartzia sp.]|nr:glycosyltransferase [Schwartzia sp. (in: firmicutes)]